MRVSIVEGDVGYVVDPYSYRVTVDGKLVDGAVTADEETGEVYAWDQDAWPQPVTRRILGKVRIERWEADGVDHPAGTWGFLDTDGFWTWSRPCDEHYESGKAKATHWWDHLDRAWINPRTVVLN